MKISIAMATYNGARYIQEQLDSFVAQTRLPDELVITDDRSSDSTLQLVKRFAESVPFPVIWEQNEENLGYAGNFNKALMKTTGDLVFLSDQDDVWFPQKLERLEAEAMNSDALVFMNDAAYTDENLQDLGLTKLGQLQSGGFSNDLFVMGCCAAIKRDLLKICLPIPAAFPAHDSWIVPMAIGMGRRIVVPEVMQWYRRHESNESQGIINHTSRLTKWKVLKLLLARRKDMVKQSVDNMELLLNGVHEGSLKVTEPYRSELKTFARKLENKQDAQLARLAIRRKAWLLRLGSVVRLWAQGGYKHTSGFKNVVRDLLLR